MKMNVVLLSAGALSALFLAGCASYFQEQRMEAARQRTEIVNQRTEVDQLKARVDALEKLVQDQDARLTALRADNDKQRQEVRDQLAAVDRAFKAYESARDADKQAIIDDLTAKIKRIADMMRSQGASSRPVAVQNPASGQGREHVVQPGETLSAIAAAYKVKVNDIVQANGLKHADSLQVGQRLIIPE
jgi:outer membrane murein-binding lipoprotein Lpp